MRVLLIKTSSLGDVIHNLPVVTDIAAHFPAARIDWVVEESFADIPRLHPAVGQVIPVAIRRWRKSLFTAKTRGEIAHFRATLRTLNYDAIIDTQGLIKSAVLSRQAHGICHGMDKASAREPLAAWLYSRQYPIARQQHAVTRNRQLAAAALGYTLSDGSDYGLIAATVAPASQDIVLLTATSRDDKLWPEAHWIDLGKRLHARGLRCLLPAGSARERERATHIAAAIPDAQLIPPSSIAQLAAPLGQARAVVGVDTGLVHLAAALGRPTVALYCASEPGLTGVMADAHSRSGVINLGGPGRIPATDAVLHALVSLL